MSRIAPLSILTWRRRYTFIMIVLVVIGLLFLLKNPFLQWMGNHLSITENVTPSDVIIVLGGESSGERTARGTQLLQQGFADQLLLSDGTSLSWRIRSVTEMMDYALLHGVARAAIHLEERSRSTYENAVYCREYMLEQGWEQAVVVTTYWHSRRSAYIFNKVFANSGIQLTYAVAPDPNVGELHEWWEDSEKMQVVLTEWSKYVVYLLTHR